MRRLLVPLFLLLLSSLALAQLAVGLEPEAVADEAVRNWQARAQMDRFSALLATSPNEACTELAALGQLPNVISNLRVNFADRRALPSEDPTVLSYSYAAGTADGSGLARVIVTLAQEGEAWRADGVRIAVEGANVGLPAFMYTDAASVVFIILSLYLVYLLLRPSWFRRLLSSGWEVILQHRGIVIGTTVALYGMYTLGMAIGFAVPECQVALGVFVGGGLQETGVVDILAEGDVPKLAAAITYWNFLMGTLTTTLSPALLFGIPAYIINLLRFMVLGLVLTPVGPQASLMLFHLPVIIIELMAYVLVTAGGGIFLMTLIREGFGGFRNALTRLLLMVPIAFLLLVIGAWYESVEIIWLLPAVFSRL